MPTAWDETAALRNAVMRDGLDVARLRGLEIGPLANPIVHRAEGDILYVDHTDTESLRRTYADRGVITAANIVEVDAVWGEQTLSACLAGRLVDYVMASHVAEHVPDLVTWLDETRAVLNPGGELRLVMPDRRFSHDALRTPTRLTDLLAAWLMRARRPQVRDVLDFRLYTASGVDGGGIFAGTATLDGVTPDHSFEVAVQSAQAARDQPKRYFDVHCLVADAGSFARLMAQLAAHGLLRMACARLIDTAPPLYEFYVFMTPCDDAATVQASWAAAAMECRDPLPGSAAAVTKQAQPDAAVWQHRAETAQAALAEAEARLRAVQASASWRLTAPLRRLRSRL